MTNPMLIESKIKRPGGTDVTLGDRTYRFRETESGGPHVATVDDPDHIGILLGIREGYRMFSPPAAAEVQDAQENQPNPAASLSDARGVRPAEPGAYDVQAQGETLHQIEPGAGETVTPADENAKPSGVDDPADAPKTLEDLSEDEIRAIHEDEVGRKAHPNAKRETMIATITAARAEASKG